MSTTIFTWLNWVLQQNKQFIMGTSGFSEEEAEKINVWHSNAETECLRLGVLELKRH